MVLSEAPVANSTIDCVPFCTPPVVEEEKEVVRVVRLTAVGIVPVPPLMIPFQAPAPVPAVKEPSLLVLNVQLAMSEKVSVYDSAGWAAMFMGV